MHTINFKRTLPIGILFLFGLLLFFPVIQTGYWEDDKSQIVNAPFIHQLSNIPLQFFVNIKHEGSTGFLLDFYYKPLLFILYSLLYNLGGGKAYLFHLVQLLLHIGNSIMLLYIFRKFMSYQLAFLLACIFLVHPINEEVVAYIANLQDVLFVGFGLAALLLTIYLKKENLAKWFLVGSLLLLACLSKESGVLWLPLLIAYASIFSPEFAKRYVLMCSAGFALYISLRILGSHYNFLKMATYSPALDLRLRYLPTVFSFYIHEFIQPTSLITKPQTLIFPTVSTTRQLLSLLTMTGVIALMSTASIYLYRVKRTIATPFTFFLIWFFLGIGLHIQIIPLDQFVAKRWFYFPIIGLLGMIGLLMSTMPRFSKYIHLVAIVLLVLVLAFFSLQTFQMNTYWQDTSVLEKHLLPW